jgi:hypothetical protein
MYVRRFRLLEGESFIQVTVLKRAFHPLDLVSARSQCRRRFAPFRSRSGHLFDDGLRLGKGQAEEFSDRQNEIYVASSIFQADVCGQNSLGVGPTYPERNRRSNQKSVRLLRA